MNEIFVMDNFNYLFILNLSVDKLGGFFFLIKL